MGFNSGFKGLRLSKVRDVFPYNCPMNV